jgi:uncharacterized membrane protein (DUF441 family)
VTARRHRMRSDEGSVLLEVVVLGVGLLVPLLYGAISIMDVEAARFAATSAAREAARAYVNAPTVSQARSNARMAASLVLHDAHRAPVQPQIRCVGGCLVPLSHVNVTVRLSVSLPLMGFSPVSVSATESMPVDRFRDMP